MHKTCPEGGMCGNMLFTMLFTIYLILLQIMAANRQPRLRLIQQDGRWVRPEEVPEVEDNDLGDQSEQEDDRVRDSSDD